MKIIEDKYDGVTIDSEALASNCEQFKARLIELIDALQGKKLLWINIPCEHAQFIPVLTELGFEFHHCAANTLMLVKKLICDPIIPNAKNFNVGVGALVLDGDNLLVIKDRFAKGYKLPGGHIDPGERIEEALIREVFEETGVKVAFASLVNIGHFIAGQFGEQNIYFVCTAKPLSKAINIYDSSEIIEARWINITEFLNSQDVNDFNKKVVGAVVNNRHASLNLIPVDVQVPHEVFL